MVKKEHQTIAIVLGIGMTKAYLLISKNLHEEVINI